ncbi:CPBP family intramembrane glutamic endopeptidase [Anaeromicrobium sediminis]|uniref:CPBP family intramembrane metalloprotease n=1 Tax=Anaeromicrobium sediminis TaxID=1478221 RepID=A0A267MK35_9FIRM|nr:CPBP family intramembrane glutamic endopeptidase [Anaeromicrobium sediminis]PAB59278.1 CPBP family intramembrane metalloprotease [Anaeromicrobium sediminis]
MKNSKKVIYLSLVICISMYIIEQILNVNYFVKSTCKIVLFTLIPYLYIKIVKKKNIKNSLHLGKFQLKRLKLGLILGFCSFTIVIIGYIIFAKYIDTQNLVDQLNKIKVNKNNFIYIGLYIIFVNSFLEEFFFRGFIFLNIYEEGNKYMAYIYSSALFALYHMGMIKSWFNIYLIILCIISLMVIGIVFNYLNTKSKNFINSWIVHILADISIILIGFKILWN